MIKRNRIQISVGEFFVGLYEYTRFVCDSDSNTIGNVK